MNLVDYFIHAANVLLLLAYSVRDILWLRVFAVASSLIAIPYFLLQPAPLWAPFAMQRHLSRDLASKLDRSTE